MKKTYLTLAVIATFMAYACNSGSPASGHDSNDTVQKAGATSNDTTQLQPTTQDDFATKAAIGGMMEVESSARMIKSTENPDVQTLATVMVKDHGMANDELKALAKKMNLQLPAALPKEKTDLLAKMEALKEEDAKNLFYADLMVKEHEEAVALFDKGSKDATGELRGFAAKHLPTLKHHLMEAKSVQKIMHKIKGDKGDLPIKTSKDNQPKH